MGLLRAGVACLVLAGAAPARGAADGLVRGRVTDPAGLPLPGVVITLVPVAGGKGPGVVSGADGLYQIAAPPGRYLLRAELSGFEPDEQPVTVATGTAADLDVRLRLAVFSERVEVKADAPETVIGAPRPDAPVTATREVVDAGMLPNSQYDDVLPLLPNVIRGPDGLISVAGASAPRGGLIVNGFNLTDPITGDAIMQVPLEAVDSVEVFTGGYPADAGRSTGGVTWVHTRSGADAWHASANSFFPRLLFAGGKPHGVEFWEPNVGASGPLVKGRLFVEDALSYRYDRNRYDTLWGPQVSQYTALMSWSQLNLQVSPSQSLAASVSFDPQATDRAGVTAFTAANSVPALDRGGWSTGLGDRLTLGRNFALELRAGFAHTRLTVTPNGTAPYEVGHDTTTGSYFDQRDLAGRRAEATAAWSWTAPGGHQVRAGATIGRTAIDGTEGAGHVDLLRSDGLLSERVTFVPTTVGISAAADEAGLFLQDRWTVSSRVTVDAGARFDQTSGAGSAVSPRVAWTAMLAGGATTLSGSVGLFTDKIPLVALAFPQTQARIVQAWDASGAPGVPRLYTNTVSGPLTMPQATRWDVGLDRRFTSRWQARVRYQERRGRHELVVDPVVTSPSEGTLALSATGGSHARSLETTVAYRAPNNGHEIFVSYVRSATSGNVNTLDYIEGESREALVLPDQIAPLRADVPNRLLAWGLLHLPARVTVAPYVEVRDGFPYSPIDDTWNYAGPALSGRLPWFGSLDLYVNKVVTLSDRLPDTRIGLKLYGLASVHTERDIQRDVSRPDYGQLYDPIPRDFSFVFELLWGKK
jgi:hypothetical protein